MLNDVKKMDISYYIIVILVCIALCLCLYRYFNPDVSDIGAGAKQIGRQLDNASTNQQTITTGVNSVKERIDNSIERIERTQTNLNSAGELISDCQQIVRTVRERGPAKATNN